MQKQTFFKYTPPHTDKQFGTAEFGQLIEELAVDIDDAKKTVIIGRERHPIWNTDKAELLASLEAQKVDRDARVIKEKEAIDDMIAAVIALN